MSENIPPPTVPVKVADKEALRRILEEQDVAAGFTITDLPTPQAVRALMVSQGIRPEENAFTCELRRTRDGE